MALSDFSALSKYASISYPDGWPRNRVDLFSPVDDVHGALRELYASATSSLIVGMYGFDDDELAQIIKDKLADPAVFVQLTLDSSQASGVHEREILARESYPASSVAVGRSEKGAIMHLKVGVVDMLDVAGGSTNESASGEGMQDNQLTISRNPLVAARYRTRLDVIHHHMLQAAAKAT